MKATRRQFVQAGLLTGAGLSLPKLALAAGSPGAAQPQAPLPSPPDAPGATAAPTAPTRGVGIYPGRPEENFSPALVLDPAAPYRNLALHRPVFHSNAYDYNLTAHLVTDGLIDTRLPDWVATLANGEVLPKPDREILLDHFQSALLTLAGTGPSVEVHLLGGPAPPAVDRLVAFVVVPQSLDPAQVRLTASTSEDGHLWTEVATAPGGTPLPTANYPPDLVHGSHLLNIPLALGTPVRKRFFRIDFAVNDQTSAAAATANAGTVQAAMAVAAPFVSWRCGQVEFHNGTERVEVGGPYSFTSAWKGAGLGQEWVYVDLGERFPFNNVRLHWIARAAEGRLQTSDDATHWTDLQPLPATDALLDDIRLSEPATARYLRVLMTRPATADGYILSELEVFGHGGFTLQPQPAPTPSPEGTLHLAGGRWRLQRIPHPRPGEAASNPETDLPGETVSQPGFADADWLPATVPGTTLVSYLNAGALPDPNFGENQLGISDSFFYADFWYRTEFPAPLATRGQRQFLDFHGINWKAEIYLNGQHLGRVEGAFTRGRFDVTGKLNAGSNALAVRVVRNATPGSCKQKTLDDAGRNGGALGADNPTFHASIGWDWISTVRGRNTGIWNDVFLVTTGAVTLQDPLLTTVLPLPDTHRADLALEVVATNHTNRPVSATLRGTLRNPRRGDGSLTFEQKVVLPASARQAIRLSSATHPQMHLQSPDLWWPVGYGEPHLYTLDLQLETGHGEVQHRLAVPVGLRQFTYNETGGALHLFINGRRLVPRGGNWGFGESMLRFRAREFDATVRFHRDMHFTMIRNWVGQIGDDAFYDACDRYGLVVWQDFWLANPWDGPVPEDNALFLANARDTVARIRRHACVGLYCGRNEWFPPAPLESGLRELLRELHPEIHYIGSSADGPVSGHGPYRAQTVPNYFRLADKKLHSEIGAPAIPPMESVRSMMPASALWPQSLDWGLHDFTLAGAQGARAFNALVAESYGGADDADTWVNLGEMVSFEAYRAMFEAQSRYRQGLLLWMSHPCWPSFVWQTYDFYLAPTAAYFGCKLGSEPLHIQWNSLAETIEVVNYSAGDRKGLLATVEVFNLDGERVLQRSAPVDSAEDSTSTPIRMAYPAGLSSVHFLSLTLSQNGTVVSSNFYLRGLEQAQYSGLRTLGKAPVRLTSEVHEQEGGWELTATLENTSPNLPALFIRLGLVRERSGDRILPALFSENYLTLLPRTSRVVRIACEFADARGERPRVTLSGLNLAAG